MSNITCITQSDNTISSLFSTGLEEEILLLKAFYYCITPNTPPSWHPTLSSSLTCFHRKIGNFWSTECYVEIVFLSYSRDETLDWLSNCWNISLLLCSLNLIQGNRELDPKAGESRSRFNTTFLPWCSSKESKSISVLLPTCENSLFV